MTSINKLTKNSVINPGDLLVIWDEENQRTRSVSYDTLQEAVPYLESAEYISPNLILTQSNGEVITVAIPSGSGIDQSIPAGTILQAINENGVIVAGVSSLKEEDGMIKSLAPLQLPGGGALQFDNNDLSTGGTISGGASGIRFTNLTDETTGYLVNVPFTNAGGSGKPFYDKFLPEFDAPSLSDRSDTRDAAFDFINPLPGIVTEYTVSRPAGSPTLTDCNFIIWLDGYNTGTPLFDFRVSNPGGGGFTLQAGLNTITPPVPIGFPANIDPSANDQTRLYSHVLDSEGNLLQLDGQEVQFPPSPDPRMETVWIPYLERKVNFSQLVELQDNITQDPTNYVGLYDSLADLQTEYSAPKDGLYASVTDASGEPDERYKADAGAWSSIGKVSGQVFVNGNNSKGITLGNGLTYEDDNGNAKITATGGGGVVVIDYDISQDNQITLNNTFDNKIANLIQSQTSLVLATITIDDSVTYNVGDVIRVQADKTYLYNFFTVFYKEDSGQQAVVYPAKNVTLIKTSSGWNVEEGGRFNRVAIRPGSASGTPIAGDDSSINNVQVISVIQSQAAEILTDSDGNSALQFDFSKLDGTSIIDDSGPATDKTYSSSKIDERAPYQVYKSISEIENDYGPITITPLDGTNDEQIRANNCVNVIAAIGTASVANLVIGNDTTLSPITYSELMFKSHNSQRTSITAFGKNNSDMWVFSASASDQGSDTNSRWAHVHMEGEELDMTGQDIINANDISIDNSGTTSIYSTNHSDQSINYFNSGDISIGAVSAVDIGINGVVKQSFVSDALDMKGTTVKNLADGVNDQDAISKLQSETFISGEFEKSANAIVNGDSSEVNLKDSTRSNGYGNPSEVINYLPLNDNTVVVPDTAYGNMWFVHEKVGSYVGYLMIHEDLLSEVVDSSTQEIPFFINSVEGALGKSAQNATVIANDSSARWNCTGGAIQSIDDANSLPPPHNYYDLQGRKGNAAKRSNALSATYTVGNTEIVGNQSLQRAEIKNVDDDSVQVLPNPTGDWFVVKARTGGGTFAVKKIFQWFPMEYADFFYSAEDFSLALGLKVDNNAIRIEELEKSSDTTPVDQDPDANGVIETISLPASLSNRIEIDSGETKTLNVGYQNDQVNLVAYDVIIKSMVTDTNDTNYGRNFEIRGAIVRSNGLISFVKSQAIGESLNLDISVANVDEHIEVTLSGAPCKLSINTKAVVKR